MLTKANLNQIERVEKAESPDRRGALRPAKQDVLRASIRTSEILERLERHAHGKVKMAPTELKAAEILLSKTLPSLQAVEINQVSDRDKMSESEIRDRIMQLSKTLGLVAPLTVASSLSAPVTSHHTHTPVPKEEDAFIPVLEVCLSCGGEVVCGGCISCGKPA